SANSAARHSADSLSAARDRAAAQLARNEWSRLAASASCASGDSSTSQRSWRRGALDDALGPATVARDGCTSFTALTWTAGPPGVAFQRFYNASRAARWKERPSASSVAGHSPV